MTKTYGLWKNSLSILKLLGLYSEKVSKKVVIFAILYSILLTAISFMLLIEFFNTAHTSELTESLISFTDTLMPFNGITQITIKIIFTAHQQEKLLKILDGTKLFWKSNMCNNGIQIKLTATATNISRLQKLFLSCVIVTIFFIELTPFTDRPLPIGMWTGSKNDLKYKMVLFGSQLVGIPLVGIFAAAFDNLFLGLNAEVIMQFRMLSYCLKKLSVSDIISEKTNKMQNTKLTLYIQRHIFLLRFLQSLQDYFSAAMFVEYVTISPLICAEMYALLESKNAEVMVVKHALMGTCLLLQLAFYCITADFVSYEALSVCDAMYNSDWYSKHSSGLLLPMVLLIQRAQQKFIFTSGGLIEMNIRTLLVVLRVSWSACALMRGLRKN